MNRLKFTTIAHAARALCSPLGFGTADRLLEGLRLSAGQRLLDVGCGKGELLLRAAETFAVAGVGVDLNPRFLGEARRSAARRAPEASLEFLEIPALELPAEGNSFDAALCIGSTHACGGFEATLDHLARRLRRGGGAAIGEGYWRRKPDPGYLEFLGATESDFAEHEGNLRLVESRGYEIVDEWVSSEVEWEEYESVYHRTVLRYAREHPGDPDREALVERIGQWRSAYLRWGRETLGFGFYVLRKR